jgi:hypothetical protein
MYLRETLERFTALLHEVSRLCKSSQDERAIAVRDDLCSIIFLSHGLQSSFQKMESEVLAFPLVASTWKVFNDHIESIMVKSRIIIIITSWSINVIADRLVF